MNGLCRAMWMGLALSLILLSGCAEDSGTKMTESVTMPPAESETAPGTEEPTSPSEGEAAPGTEDPALPSEDGEDPETQPPAPTISFEATDLEGNAVSSDMFSQSKLTMINVWATYCNPCLSEMPELGELAAEYDAEDFQLIGIVSDVMEGEDQALAERLVQDTGADYPHLLLNQSLYDALLSGVSAVPTTFFLDSDGTPLGYVLGAKEKSVWEEIINGLLEEL